MFKFKKKLLRAIVFAAILGAYSTIICEIKAHEPPDVNVQNMPHTIKVKGSAKKTFSPDIVYISFQVESIAADQETARRLNASKTSSIIRMLGKMGVIEKDLDSRNFNIYPKYEYNKHLKKSEIKAYRATRSFKLRTRDLDKVADLVANIVNEGASKLNSVSYALEFPKKAKKELLAEASKDAYEKASLILSGFQNSSLGKLVYVSESSSNYTPSYRRSFAKADMMTMAEAVPIPGTKEAYSKGEINLEATLSCIFLID